MKKREKYAYIALLATAVLIFISFTLTKFNEDIQKRVYKLQVTSLQNLSKQGGAVVEKNLEGMVNTLYALVEPACKKPGGMCGADGFVCADH